MSYVKYIKDQPNIFHTIKINQISCGDGFTMLLDSSNNLYSFGRNDEGQLGFSLDYSKYAIINGKKTLLKPSKIEFFSAEKNLTIKSFVCGSNFTFVLDESNIAYSFGDNSNGQLARNTGGYAVNPNPAVAEFLSPLGQIGKICCGWSHALLLNVNSEVYVWGNYFKDYKKVCDDVDDIVFPKKIEIEDDYVNEENCENDEKFEEINFDENKQNIIIDIASGFNHLAIIVLRGNNKAKELYTWGANEFVNLI